MRTFRNLPLKEKLILLTLGVSFSTLVLASAAFYYYQLRNEQLKSLESASITSRVIASSVTAAVAFQDRDAATEALAAFKQNPDVTRALIVTNTSKLFSIYTKLPERPGFNIPKTIGRKGYFLGHNRIIVKTPITHSGEHLGDLYTEHSLARFHTWVRHSIGVALLVLGFGCLLAYILALRSAKYFLSPILSLSRSMTEVSATRNYGVRVAHSSDDEIGNLVLQFNQMLTEIEARDSMLQNYQTTLEQKVSERTAELQSEVKRRAVIESALRREQLQLRTVIESSPVAIAMFDNDMRYIAHSHQWLLEIGSQKSLVGKYYDAASHQISDRWTAGYRAALLGSVQTCAEDSFLSPDDTMFYLRWAMHPWTTPEGIQGGIIIAMQRIDDLVRGREEAIRTATTRSQFLANVSHELRTPLNGILGFTDLLLDEEEMKREHVTYLDAIKSSGQLLLTLINDILDFSKLEQKKLGLEILPLSLTDLVQSAINIIRPSVTAKALKLEVSIDQAIPPQLLGDSLRLKQILVNLLGNAAKFTIQGSISITVRLIDEQVNGVSLLFSVSDTGIGIPEDKLGLIFEAFAQVDGSTTRKFGGTGLGLTICSQLVQLMGGHIWVESESDAGSNFSFTVVLQKLEKEVLPPPGQAVTNSGRFIIPPTRTLSILVAEDNPLNQRLIVTLLRKAGHRVVIAGNGEEAVDRFGECEFDIIFMDLQMPVLGGLDATRIIRQRENGKRGSVPIVALTAHAFDDHRQLCLDAGMNGFLTKPINREELFQTISSVTEPVVKA